MKALGTYNAKPADVKASWHVIDASGQPLGRLASRIAQILQGKHKPIYTRHVKTGDFVVVVNAGQVRVTGHKATQKMYYRHSGYLGSLRATPLFKVLERYPERVVQRAVKGMLPDTRLGRQMFGRLKVYGAAVHPHQAQVNAGTGARSARLKVDAAVEMPPTKSGSKGRIRKSKSNDKSTDVVADSNHGKGIVDTESKATTKRGSEATRKKSAAPKGGTRAVRKTSATPRKEGNGGSS